MNFSPLNIKIYSPFPILKSGIIFPFPGNSILNINLLSFKYWEYFGEYPLFCKVKPNSSIKYFFNVIEFIFSFNLIELLFSSK